MPFHSNREFQHRHENRNRALLRPVSNQTVEEQKFAAFKFHSQLMINQNYLLRLAFNRASTSLPLAPPPTIPAALSLASKLTSSVEPASSLAASN